MERPRDEGLAPPLAEDSICEQGQIFPQTIVTESGGLKKGGFGVESPEVY